MGSTDVARLRLRRMAAESILKEKLLPRERLDRVSIALIAGQLRGIVKEMETEWMNNPTSGELRDAFRLLSDYVDCLEEAPPELANGLS